MVRRLSLAAVLAAVSFAVSIPAGATGGCAVTEADAPGASGFPPPPAVFWAGVMVSDPDLFEAVPPGSAALARAETALTADGQGLGGFFDLVGADWIAWRGSFENLKAEGVNPMAEEMRRYMGAFVSIDRLIAFEPTRMRFGSGTLAERHLQILFGSINLFDAQSMSIAFSWPFAITQRFKDAGDKLSPAGLLADPQKGLKGIVRTMAAPDNPSARASACQLKGAVLRYMGLDAASRATGEGNARILFDGFQRVRVCPGCVQVKGVLSAGEATTRRMRDLLVYLARTKVAQQKPVAPVANANREAVMTQGRAAIMTQHDDRVQEAGHACGFMTERVAWNDSGQRVICFEIPSFARELVLGLSLMSKRQKRADGRSELAIDSIVHVGIVEGPRVAKANFSYPPTHTHLDPSDGAMTWTDGYLATPVIEDIQQIDISSMER